MTLTAPGVDTPAPTIGDARPTLAGWRRRAECDLEIVVPAYNEEKRLPATLASLLPQIARLEDVHARVVVVDNGSCDRTSDIVDRIDSPLISVIGCSIPGKGAAVRRGILTSRARHVGFLDADSSVRAEVLHEAYELLEDGCDIVIASRRCPGALYKVKQSPVRRMGSWAFRRAVHSLVPGVADTQCGFKFFSNAAAARIFPQLSTAGFSFDVELLARAHACGYTIEELPVDWSDDVASSLKPVQHGGQILREVIQLRRLGAGLSAEVA